MSPPESGWFLGWLGLAIAVVVLSDYPAIAPVLRYTLLALIAYVALANAARFGPPLARWVDSISRPAVGQGESAPRRQ